MTAEKKAILKNSILSAVFFGLIFGLFEALIFNLDYALIAGPIAGLFFGIFIFFFLSSKKVNQQTALEDSTKGDIIYSGAANHFKNSEAVGGKLYLLNDRLVFKSHAFNIQNHSVQIEISAITEIAFYSTLGVVPNGLQFALKDGVIEKFVVNNRKLWKANIEKLIV